MFFPNICDSRKALEDIARMDKEKEDLLATNSRLVADIEKTMADANISIESLPEEWHRFLADTRLPAKEFNIFEKVPYTIQLNYAPNGLDEKFNSENLLGDSIDLADLEFEQDFLQDRSKLNSNHCYRRICTKKQSGKLCLFLTALLKGI
jgi:hypothetical protein